MKDFVSHSSAQKWDLKRLEEMVAGWNETYLATLVEYQHFSSGILLNKRRESSMGCSLLNPIMTNLYLVAEALELTILRPPNWIRYVNGFLRELGTLERWTECLISVEILFFHNSKIGKNTLRKLISCLQLVPYFYHILTPSFGRKFTCLHYISLYFWPLYTLI